MIPTLYEPFRHWSEHGSVYIISDTHFDDADCKTMSNHWIDPTEHIKRIASKAHKCDTLIHLGDVGDPSYFETAWKNKHKRPHMVLIMGNHDESAERFEPIFDEIYTGPLFIAEKILLSHEPVYGIDWCLNIHGHDHNESGKTDLHHINLASNVVDFQVANLDDIIKSGIMKKSKGIHRTTIDKAIKKPIHKKK